MTEPRRPTHLLACLAAALLMGGAPALQAQTAPDGPRPGDYIVAVVNSELVTAGEVQKRIDRVRQDAARNNARLPSDAELRKQITDALIDERVLITYARDMGVKVDPAEIDRAVANIASQNKITLDQLRAQLQAEGMDYGRFRDTLRDQIAVERVRERDVVARIQPTDREIDALLDQQRAAVGASIEYNIAQILVTVPEGASEAVVAERRARAEAALARVKAGEPFATVAKEVSEDANRNNGGEIGMRPAERLPDLFVEAVRPLAPGQVSPALLRSGAGYHVLKLVDKRDGRAFTITQTRARHILLRPSPQLNQEAALRRLADLKRQIEAGTISFEQAARDNSEDGSAAQGGELGWASPGTFVPEFERAIAGVPVGGMTDPFVSRFGAHLVQVEERRNVELDLKQQREQARNVLREQKFAEAYAEWIRDLRARAYVELREPPS
ncbi:MAG: peptidylprolyl isomerase [Rhizobacter sp.]|nr:peptidylprolyl isomerase [Burkholderiaceae bacterium]MCO5122664.1 peptidylprolyl isomerase [Rhizobacter sp.]